MKRLFVAIKIQPDKDFLDAFHLLQRQCVHERIKWVEDHNIHITLKFFGETEEKKIPSIENTLNQTARQFVPFKIRLVSLGIFGSRYDPRVIWIGIQPYDKLVRVMKMMQEQLIPLGYIPDRQNLVPHLTLGRIKGLKDKALFQQTVDRFRDLSSREMEVHSFILYESILKKEGPVYIALKNFFLE